MRVYILLLIFFCCNFSWSAEDAKISLHIQLSKTEFHHLEPVTVRLKIANIGKTDFVFKSSMVCCDDMKIDMGDSSTVRGLVPLEGGVIIPSGKNLEIIMPERVFLPGEHNVSLALYTPCLRGVSNEISVKVRKATKEESLAWIKQCYDIYEKMKQADKSGDRESMAQLHHLLLLRLNHEIVFSIPIMAKMLDDDLIGMNDKEREIFICSIGGKIYNGRSDLEKNINIRYVIATVNKWFKKKRNIVMIDSVARELLPYMKKEEAGRYKDALKEIICTTKDEEIFYEMSVPLLGYFPEEYAVVEKRLNGPVFSNIHYKKEINERIESAKKRIPSTR